MQKLHYLYALKNYPVKQTTAGSLAALLIVVWILLALFFKIASLVESGRSLPSDVAILQWINSMSTPWLDVIIPFVTFLADSIVVIAAGFTLSIVCIVAKKWGNLAQIFFGLSGAAVAMYFLKQFFERPRPELWDRLVEVSNYSFPSGHSTLASALALTAIIVFWHTKYRTGLVATGSLYVFVIGMTRVYLGVHYPTDVVAGWFLGASVVVTVFIVVSIFRSPEHNSAKLANEPETQKDR